MLKGRPLPLQNFKEGRLVLVRHGESEGNRAKIFTGLRDVKLTDLGRQQARDIGKRFRASNMAFNMAFTSELARARDTAELILEQLEGTVALRCSADLNERDYGALTGLTEGQAAAKWSVEDVRRWRRSWEVGPPGGESLKDTAARMRPFYHDEIEPHLLRGEWVLIVGHGNSLRSLVMGLERMTSFEIEKFEFANGEVRSYRVGRDAEASLFRSH